MTLAFCEGKTTSVHCSKVTSYHIADAFYVPKSPQLRGSLDTKADLDKNPILILNVYCWHKELDATNVSFMIINLTFAISCSLAQLIPINKVLTFKKSDGNSPYDQVKVQYFEPHKVRC